MWTYSIGTRELTHDGAIVDTNGYTGHGEYKNDPAYQNLVNLGPIPVGEYTIGPPFTHAVCGPISMRLSPEPQNQMYGRAGFLIHGDSIADPGTASDGCIILSRPIRLMIAESDDNDLTVIA